MANRLADQTSPYLLQHAHNPVDWFPWGAEAMAKAKAEDKPILLSIGYAACHWCHVMERESFEDDATAAVMNEHFVNVKVDREERPDVDAIYMAATQALTGRGGWPMTVFCSPDGTPFLAGTYFPPADAHGMPAFTKVLAHVNELWTTRRPELEQQGQQLLEAIERATPPPSNEPLQGSLLTRAARQILATFDDAHGGFGGAPKFPQVPVLDFLMRLHVRVPGVREALELTLKEMALGGIYDQLGGGFARYAVDDTWTVPHFEKMLYDNALLARLYTRAWQAWDKPLYRRIAIETIEYLLRDMRDDAGGFHASEDADSESVEGKFYVFGHDEFMSIAPDAAAFYGVTPEGNFEGLNILTAPEDDEAPQEAKAALLAYRNQRIRPGKDDKVLASWNGLAISALAEAGAAFERADFLDAAREAATFVLQRDPIQHSYRAGTFAIDALLEDYAFLAEGLLALYEATFEIRWLHESRRLARRAIELFGDPRNGGFYTVQPDHDLIVRQKEIVESATPAPGAVLAVVAQKLGLLFDDTGLAKPAVDALRLAHPYMDRAGQAVPTWLSALDFYLATPKEIAFTGDTSSPEGLELVRVVRDRFLPNKVMAATNGEDGEVALLRDKPPGDRVTAYVCERYVCQAPTSDPAELASQLG